MITKRIWDNYEEIAEIRKSSNIKLVVAAATREGFRYINIREFYLTKKTNEWKPGRDGITVPIKAAINEGAEFIAPAEDFIEAFVKATERAYVMPLMDKDKAVWMTKE